ncbi:MAG: zinc ribbon domain-containing protein [Candidatus Baldrarchaeia archaeon]
MSWDNEKIRIRLLEAREHLVKALQKFKSSRNWSFLDMFLGGSVSFFADLMEHARFSEALDEIRRAKQIIVQVQEHIGDVDLEIGDNFFGTFLDVAFDNIFVDLLRHGRINKARKKVIEVIRKIDSVLLSLRANITKEEEKFCPRCKASIPVNSKFCPYCGERQ